MRRVVARLAPFAIAGTDAGQSPLAFGSISCALTKPRLAEPQRARTA
jgi:hypothetical protein